MANFPAAFRRAIESLYTDAPLSPFMETAVECLEAAFEAANAKRSLSRKEAVAALIQTGAYKDTPYERTGGWQNTDLRLIKDAYNKHVAKGNRSKMIAEVAEDEPEPWVPSSRAANPTTPQQSKAASQPAQNAQAQNNPATRQNANAAAQAVKTGTAAQAGTSASAANSGSYGSQSRAAAPQLQPSQLSSASSGAGNSNAGTQSGTNAGRSSSGKEQSNSSGSSNAVASSSSNARQQEAQSQNGNNVSCRSINDRVKNPNVCKNRIF